MSVGYDHVDTAALKVRDIPLGYTPDVLTEATADTTALLVLVAARRIREAIHAVEQGAWGTWSPTWMCGHQLTGKTLGVVGLGRIGEATAHRLKAFGMSEVLYWGRSRRYQAEERLGAKHVSLEELLAVSDVVIVFVNTARGGIVDQEGLVRALQEKEIAAAGLDVTTPEPLPIDSPLLKLSNCTVFPHIGSATYEARESMARVCVDNVLAGIQYEPLPYEKYKVIPRGGVVIDCGAAPGGWTQVAVARVQKKGLVIAVDLLPVDPIEGASILKGDFMTGTVQAHVRKLLEERPVDLVCSDMAPNFTGNHMADHARSMELCESALEFAQTVLAPGGCFVAKFLMGGTEVEFKLKLQTLFTKVKQEKPDASRKQSTESFFVALNYCPPTEKSTTAEADT
ncbi:FtsJ-like methyltransferase-domain-containing protein [Spinellus fusiger]|nr:FtsJ-like methyltransferase-domain-containing protein [Spinellus fusiger]